MGTINNKKRSSRIEDPFSTGLASKIYWALYIQPDIEYRLSKKIYGKANPPRDKVHKVLTMLKDKGFVYRDPQKIYHINYDKLIERLLEILKKENTSITDDCQFIIQTIVKSSITHTYFSKFKPVTLIQKQPPEKVSFMANFTTLISLTALALSHHQEKYPKEKDKLRNEVRKINQHNKKPITFEELFSYEINFLEEYLNDPNKANKLINDVKKTVNNQTPPNEIIFYLWNLMFLNIPYNELLKITKLSKKAVLAHELAFASGNVFTMNETDALNHIKRVLSIAT